MIHLFVCTFVYHMSPTMECKFQEGRDRICFILYSTLAPDPTGWYVTKWSMNI